MATQAERALTERAEQALVETCRHSLAVFLAAVFRAEGRPAFPPAHLKPVIDAIEDDSLGHTVIIAPPGSAKTNTMMAACAWWLGQDPTQHIGYISNTAAQAYNRSAAIRSVIEANNNYRAIFPRTLPDKGRGWAEAEWFLARPDVNDKDPSLLAAGVGGPILGARWQRVVYDDIADVENMATELQRRKVIHWLQTTAQSRLTPDGRAIIICTRWHEDDPAAWALEQGWHVVHFPALDRGESYWPERWPASHFDCGETHRDPPRCCERARLGTGLFNLMYQGEVADESSAMFKRAWWLRYRTLPAAATHGYGFLDTVQVDKPGSDFYALSTWRTDGARYYVTDSIKTRGSWPDMRQRISDWYARENLPLVVENVSWANPQIQDLEEMSRIPGIHMRTGQPSGRRMGPPILRFDIEGRSKITRAQPYSARVEAGLVLLPESAPWVDDWVSEHAVFPNGAHDDQVDTGSMAILRFELDRPLDFSRPLQGPAITNGAGAMSLRY